MLINLRPIVSVHRPTSGHAIQFGVTFRDRLVSATLAELAKQEEALGRALTQSERNGVLIDLNNKLELEGQGPLSPAESYVLRNSQDSPGSDDSVGDGDTK